MKQFTIKGEITAHLVNYLDAVVGAGMYYIDEKARELHFTHSLTGVWNCLALPLKEPIVTEMVCSLDSTKELKTWLVDEKGWVPTIWNRNKDGDKTSPSLFEKTTGEPCPNLWYALNVAYVQQIRDHSVVKSRLASLKGLLSRQQSGVIYADADTAGTPTARFKHRSVVNIPRVTTPYGSEMRALFGPVNRGNWQVGWDASSLEAVMEAHYVYPYDKEYATELVTGDVHQRNKDLLNFGNRDQAKRFKYAIMYGAGPAKLASTLSVDKATAEAWYTEFWEANKGLKTLKSRLYDEWVSTNKQYIKGIDGRRLYTRYEHALLNTLFQGGGAILMKYAFLLAAKYADKDFKGVTFPLIRYHDEEQWECPPNEEWANELGALGVKSIQDAGRCLGLNVPITGEYKIGKNWADCH